MCGTMYVWITLRLRTFFLERRKVTTFQKGQKSAFFLAIFLDKKAENLDDLGCPKNRPLADTRADEETWICSSYPF